MLRVDVEGEDLWFKRWYGSHDVGYTIDPSLGGAGLSPFFARMKSLEYEIIHSLFPGATIDMFGGYDPRCIVDETRGEIIRCGIIGGRPTTVSKNVEGDSELIAKYDEIVVPAQKLALDYLQKNIKEGRRTNDMDSFYISFRRDVNMMVHELLGDELSFPMMQVRDRADYLQQVAGIATKLRKRNSSNIIPDMVDAGIYPIHPEINFIPGNEQTHERPPYGTFIELKIFDEDTLFRKVKKLFKNDPEKHQEIKDQINDWLVLRKLHLIFHKIVFETTYAPANDQLKFGADFITVLSNYLYKLYSRYMAKEIDDGMLDRECGRVVDKAKMVMAG